MFPALPPALRDELHRENQRELERRYRRRAEREQARLLKPARRQDPLAEREPAGTPR